jgi:KamA family protein
MHTSTANSPRYRAITARNFLEQPQCAALPKDVRHSIQVASHVLPFRTNEYVIDQLIDWNNVPDDPIFQLTFTQGSMLQREDFLSVERVLAQGGSGEDVAAVVSKIRSRLNPHPAGQMTDNVPTWEGRPLEGVQHKYGETLLYFPSQGQTCHAYCTFCFRWAQFVGMPDMKFQSKNPQRLTGYLRAHPRVTDVLITGGDPLVMKTSSLASHLAPLLDIESVQNIRIGTKSVAYWPYRFVSDPDADDLLRLFERVTASGRHLSIMGHYSHPRELSTPVAQAAIQRIRSTGAHVRMQSPVLRHINDDPNTWAEMWRLGVRLGAIPYYMFVERDTGPHQYFELPLVRTKEIFDEAYRQVSGLARTVRGPSMSAWPGKVQVDGSPTIRGERVFALRFLQARDPAWVGRPFFAEFDPEATWLSDLRPAFGEPRFFFEDAQAQPRREPRREPNSQSLVQLSRRTPANPCPRPASL